MILLALYDQRPCVLYRAFAADGTLLYVGSTVDLTARLAQHRYRKPEWRTRVVRIETRPFPRWWLARLAEAEAIEQEHPLWNSRRSWSIFRSTSALAAA